jgi:hypothetical protein
VCCIFIGVIGIFGVILFFLPDTQWVRS